MFTIIREIICVAVQQAKASFPGFIAPALATKVGRVPRDKRSIHEIKFDGYRVQVHGTIGRTGLLRILIRHAKDDLKWIAVDPSDGFKRGRSKEIRA